MIRNTSKKIKLMSDIFKEYAVPTDKRNCPVCKMMFESKSNICPKCGMVCGDQTVEMEYRNYTDITHQKIEISDTDLINLTNKYHRAPLANYYVPYPDISNISRSKTVLFCHDSYNDSWAIRHALEIEKITEAHGIKPLFGFTCGDKILLPRKNNAYIWLWNCGEKCRFDVDFRIIASLMEKYNFYSNIYCNA